MKENTINNTFNIDDTAIKNQATITDICSNGQNHVDVNLEKDYMVDILNKKTSGVATMIKPFKIMADTAMDANMPFTASYMSNISRNIQIMDNHVRRALICDYLRYPIMDAINTTAGLIRNEFESLSDTIIERIKSCGYVLTDRFGDKFLNMIDIDSIFNYLIDKVGCDILEDLYRSSFTDKKKDNDFYMIVQMYADPFIVSYANTVTSMLTDMVYDKLYYSFLCELDSHDFATVCLYIKPALLSFRDDIVLISRNLVYELIKHRISSTPAQLAEGYELV